MAQFGDFTVDRNSTKYVLGSGGTIISYATDEPAFEFNADGSYKGLLVEPAATNLLKYSEEFDEAVWTKAPGVSVTANTDVAPDGTTTADTVTSGANQIDQAVSCSTSTTYTDSLYFKKTTGATYTPGMYLIFTGGTFIIYAVVLNTDTGVATAVSAGGFTTPDAFSVSDQGDYWRLSITGSSGNNTTVSLRLYPNLNTAGGSGAGSQIVWGAQLETGPIATSYIPTTTASVTRVKDDITQTSASSLIGQTEGTLYVEVDWRLATGTFQHLLDATNGLDNNRFVIYNSGTANELRMLAVSDGSVLTNQGEASTAYTGIQKIAFAYADSDFELYRNGSSISSDTTGSLSALATLTDIDLGQYVDTSLQANMWIRAVALYKTRLTNDQLADLTS